MLLNVLSNGERLRVPIQYMFDDLADELSSCNAPFYTCDGEEKLIEKVNCSKTNIEFANVHTLYVKAYKETYVIVLSWWAGERMLAHYDDYDEGMRHLKARKQCYQGNGVISLRKDKITKWIKVDEDVLEKIVDSYDSVHREITFKYE